MSEPASLRRLVVFDGDDTLWSSQVLYEDAKTSICALVDELGLDARRWIQVLEEVDMDRARTYGRQRGRFPGSCVLAFKAVASEARRRPDAILLHRIHSIGDTVFTRHAELAKDAAEVLSRLHEDYLLTLVTQGDPSVQEERIRHSGLRGYFDAVRIVATKDERSFEETVSEYSLAPSDAWSVGNSLRSDIYPALRIGMHAIRLLSLTWGFDDANQKPEGVIEVSTLTEAARILVAGRVVGPAA